MELKRALHASSFLAFFLPALGPISAPAAERPLAVCVTTPDLASLVREIGGDQVSVTTLAKGPQDPHFLDAKPSFIRELNRADLFVQAGMGLEVGWAPVLLQSAKNSNVRAGSAGFLDCSAGVNAIFPHGKQLDRTLGDVHPQGNPHYLLDPLNGLHAATLIHRKLVELRPNQRSKFERRLATLRSEIANSLFGETLVASYGAGGAAKLLKILGHAKGGRKLLFDVLKKDQKLTLLGGWLGALLPYQGQKVVADHNLWPYFCRRFEVEVVDSLEPKPGIAPTTRHLTHLVKRMRDEKIRAVLSVPYFDRRHSEFVARHAGAVVARLAHQVNARAGANDYKGMISHNVKALVEALRGKLSGKKTKP